MPCYGDRLSDLAEAMKLGSSSTIHVPPIKSLLHNPKETTYDVEELHHPVSERPKLADTIASLTVINHCANAIQRLGRLESQIEPAVNLPSYLNRPPAPKTRPIQTCVWVGRVVRRIGRIGLGNGTLTVRAWRSPRSIAACA